MAGLYRFCQQGLTALIAECSQIGSGGFPAGGQWGQHLIRETGLQRLRAIHQAAAKKLYQLAIAGIKVMFIIVRTAGCMRIEVFYRFGQWGVLR